MKTNLKKDQVDIIYNLIKIWNSNSELRFNQLVNNLVLDYSNKHDKKLHTSNATVDAFYLEDKEFNKFLEDLIDDLT